MTACAGNDFERGNNPWYPAAYNTTFAVTNIDQNDDRFFASNTGDYIDIAAPGKQKNLIPHLHFLRRVLTRI